MFIPQFILGFIAGLMVTIVGIIACAFWCSRRTDEKENKKKGD